MISEIYNKTVELKLLSDSNSDCVSEEVKKQISRLCATVCEDLASGDFSPEIVTLFPLNEQEQAAFSLAVPEEQIDPEPSELQSNLSYMPKAGDVVSFGNYEWIVLACDKETQSCMVVSKDILFYSGLAGGDYQGWGESLLRRWLNGAFMISLDAEVDRIVKVRSVKLPETVDSIFLLSPEEVEKLMTPEQRSIGERWWLRTGDTNSAIVNTDGSISRGVPTDTKAGIRPALVISMVSPLEKVTEIGQ